MRLSKSTIKAISDTIKARNANIASIIDSYKARSLTFRRFTWDVWHSFGHPLQVEILTKHNDVKVIGGYVQGVTDDNIETALKAALKEFAY